MSLSARWTPEFSLNVDPRDMSSQNLHNVESDHIAVAPSVHGLQRQCVVSENVTNINTKLQVYVQNVKSFRRKPWLGRPVGIHGGSHVASDH